LEVNALKEWREEGFFEPLQRCLEEESQDIFQQLYQQAPENLLSWRFLLMFSLLIANRLGEEAGGEGGGRLPSDLQRWLLGLIAPVNEDE